SFACLAGVIDDRLLMQRTDVLAGKHVSIFPLFKSMSNRCTLRIFVYEDFERREVNRSENLTYISAQDEKGEVFPAERKRR
ncbi:MAG: hypothetical protein WBG13_27685, partial [Pseudolabrys sp.]